MSDALTLSMKLLLERGQWVQGLRASTQDVGKFGSSVRSELGALPKLGRAARSEFDRLRTSLGGVRGKLIELGVMVGTTATVIQSARLDKNLDKIGLTAGAGKVEVKLLRGELFKLAKDTATPIENLQDSFDLLIRSGANWSDSIELLKAAGREAARSGEDVQTLVDAMSNASDAFKIDLSRPKAAQQILDRLSVAATQGKARLGTLATALERVGPDAREKAGLNLEQTLALVQTMASRESTPRRMLPMFESTVGLFSNRDSLRGIQRGSGISTLDGQGNPRNMLDILDQLKARVDPMGNRQRMSFMARVFQGADSNAVKGVETLFDGNNLAQLRAQAATNAQRGVGSDANGKAAIDNMIDQVQRLKAAMQDAGDSFAKPVKSSVDYAIKKLLDSNQDGGLGLSGGAILGGGAAAIGAAYYAKRFGGKAVGSLLGMAGGVAGGKALEEMAGVTPVFVVNMPNGGVSSGTGNGLLDGLLGGGAAGIATKAFKGLRAGAALLLGARSVGSIGAFGATGMLGAGAMVAGAGAAGYGLGSLINLGIESTELANKIGEAVALALASLGNQGARDAIKSAEDYKAHVAIELTDKRARVTKMETSDERLKMSLSNLGSIMRDIE